MVRTRLSSNGPGENSILTARVVRTYTDIHQHKTCTPRRMMTYAFAMNRICTKSDGTFVCFSLVFREVASGKARCTGRRECAAGGGWSAQSGSVSCCSLCCFSLAVHHHWGIPPRLTELGGLAVPAIAGRYQRLHLRVHRSGVRAAVVTLPPQDTTSAHPRGCQRCGVCGTSR